MREMYRQRSLSLDYVQELRVNSHNSEPYRNYRSRRVGFVNLYARVFLLKALLARSRRPRRRMFHLNPRVA